jgi:hypothetical protein
MHETAHTTKTVEVTVIFPLSTRDDYHHKAEKHETVAKLRAAAMTVSACMSGRFVSISRSWSPYPGRSIGLLLRIAW